jgi:hypothetical protein
MSDNVPGKIAGHFLVRNNRAQGLGGKARSASYLVSRF